MKEIKKQISKMQAKVAMTNTSQQIQRCDFCVGDHPND